MATWCFSALSPGLPQGPSTCGAAAFIMLPVGVWQPREMVEEAESHGWQVSSQQGGPDSEPRLSVSLGFIIQRAKLSPKPQRETGTRFGASAGQEIGKYDPRRPCTPGKGPSVPRPLAGLGDRLLVQHWEFVWGSSVLRYEGSLQPEPRLSHGASHTPPQARGGEGEGER